MRGTALASKYDGTLWIGSARSSDQISANGGSPYHLRLIADRLSVDTSAEAQLADRVADTLSRA